MNQQDQKLYQDHIDGILNGQPLIAFEKRLTEDADFRVGYGIYKSMEAFLDTQDSRGKALEAIRSVAADKKIANPQKEKPNKTFRVALAVGAILASIFLMLLLKDRSTPTPNNYAALYVEPPWPVERSNNQDSISLAISKYLSGDKKTAVSILRSINNQESTYWLTELYAKEVRSDSVLHYLPSRYKDNIRRDRILYLKILALHESGQKEKAKQEIAALPSDMDEWYVGRLAILK